MNGSNPYIDHKGDFDHSFSDDIRKLVLQCKFSRIIELSKKTVKHNNAFLFEKEICYSI